MRRSVALDGELVDPHSRGVGNLVAEQAKDLLADELGGEEALVAIGEVVLGIQRRRHAAGARRSRPQARAAACPAPPISARSPRTGTAPRSPRCAAAAPPCPATRSILLTAATTGTRAGSSANDRAIGVGDPRGIDHEHHDTSTPPSASRTARLRRSLSARAMPRLEAGRVDVHHLRVVAGDDAEDAIARRLRLLRRDADLLADERVHERRLADARPADDRDVAAAKRGRCTLSASPRGFPGSPCVGACASATSAAACSAARRLLPRAGGDDAQRGNSAFDVEQLRVRFAGASR